MRIRTLARRSVATLAATALLTTGGAALGLSTGVANAQTVTNLKRAGGGDPIAVNNGVSTFEVGGSDFMPSNQETVVVSPHSPIAGQGGITGTVRDNSAQCAKNIFGGVSQDAKCAGPLVFDVNLSMAAPGVYDVTVTQYPKGGLTNTPEPDVCASCLTVVSAGPATTTTVAPSGTSNGPLTITGTHFAHGASVKFFNTDANGAATTVDPLITLGAINIVSPTTLTGNYSAQPGDSGRKVVRVFNLDDTVAPGPGAAFLQPKVTSISPVTLGQGATSAALTVNGDGFNANSTVAFSDPKVAAAGPIVLDPSGASFVVPVSVASDTTPGAKSLTVKSPGGGFTTVNNALTVTAAPRVTSVSPASRGQGSTTVITVNGSGFTANTVFDFGAGTTTTPTGAPGSATSRTVNLAVAPDAAVGPRQVSATNPDKGTSSLANAITIAPKPMITSVDPASGDPTASVPVKIYGRDFEAGGVTVTLSGTGVTVGAVTVVSSTELSTTFTSNAAPFGPRDVTVVNNGSQGRSTCTGCYGINSMSITPNTAVNNASKTLTLTGTGLTSSSVPILTIPGSQTYQGPITGTVVPCGTPAAGTICAQFDLTGVATGKYTVTATTANGPLTCTSCLTVVSAVSPAPTTVNPASGGQGAQLRTIQIAGSGFSPGEDVIFSGTGITTSKVTYNSPSLITAIVSIAENAATGGRSVTVKNIGDGRSGTTSPTAFTVNPSPKITAIDVKQLGQNGVADVTVTGSNFVAGTTADFGPGTTAVVKGTPTATSLVATVTVADGAGAGPRDVRVTNPDGGSSALTGQFRVTPAPRISSIAPSIGKPGDTKSVVITGTGFATSPATPSSNTTPTDCPSGASPAVACPTVIVAGILATVKSVSVDGTSMTADFAISSQAPISNPAVKVINPDRGQSSKVGGFTIAKVPTAPKNVAVTVTGTTTKVTWTYTDTSPTNGGSPLTSFVVDDGDASTINTQTLAPSAREATFSGLSTTKIYTFSVKAVNAVGQSDPGVVATSQYDTSLTATRSKQIAAPGDQIHYTGKLTRSGGTGAPGAAIIVTLDPDVGPTRVFTTHTNSIGVWGFRYPTYYNMTVSAKFLGNATDNASVATGFRLATITRVVKKTPASGDVSSHTTPLVITGYCSPNKAGRVVYLVKGNGALVARATVASNSTFTFRVNLPAGNHLLAVVIKPGTGNIGGSTPFFAVKRT